jgi:hypothetical protein
MVRGRPKGDEPTCVLAVRVPIALREQLDRYLDSIGNFIFRSSEAPMTQG